MQEVLTAIVYALPAYVTNGTPVVVLRVLGVGHPLDRGKAFWDGRRLLGDGKTFEGLASGVLAGLLASAAVYTFFPGTYRRFLESALLTLGAMAGDILGSFIKRRLGLERGRSAPVLDQLGFMVAALLIAWLPFGPPSWANTTSLTALLLVTAILHVSTNIMAYFAGLKEKWY
ncbi:MAG: CDP-2,3-bis-(O-geranylgeranyl)-sn-glycerol synthase [Nitrososphaerota archaeon]|nr:CDP-2,3-bis-(O-geranylgeranyl)-sn-glycerol synthase [Candidatus Calditenuaceae archaeon]MDW8072654.1 CDP-2,3-bis-(O-geranylgeranyl)-sn-glycerol synthase [Nitrososphaerota archaeon]